MPCWPSRRVRPAPQNRRRHLAPDRTGTNRQSRRPPERPWPRHHPPRPGRSRCRRPARRCVAGSVPPLSRRPRSTEREVGAGAGADADALGAAEGAVVVPGPVRTGSGVSDPREAGRLVGALVAAEDVAVCWWMRWIVAVVADVMVVVPMDADCAAESSFGTYPPLWRPWRPRRPADPHASGTGRIGPFRPTARGSVRQSPMRRRRRGQARSPACSPLDADAASVISSDLRAPGPQRHEAGQQERSANYRDQQRRGRCRYRRQPAHRCRPERRAERHRGRRWSGRRRRASCPRPSRWHRRWSRCPR